MPAVLELDKDRMLAAIRLPAGETLDPAAAWDLLARAGVVAGVKAEGLLALTNAAESERVIAIAEGIRPVAGWDGRIEHLIETGIRSAVDGTIDWHEQRQMVEVVEGRELARIHPPDPGRPGRDVSGRVLPPPPVREIDPAKVVGDGSRFVDGRVEAASAGVFQRQRDKVMVLPMVPIQGDLDHHHGNLDSRFPVRISGDIRTGFVVKSLGSIEVGGAIEDARVSAQGDLIVKGGILPGYERVKAVGALSARHIDGRTINAGRIEVGGSILHSLLLVSGEVIARHLIGGTCTCGGSVTVDVLGSPAGLPTVVQVGIDPYEEALWKAAVADHELAKTAVSDARQRVQLVSHRLRDHAAHGVDSGPDKAELAEALHIFEEAALRLHTGEHLVADHAARLRVLPATTATVTARSIAHPGVIIGIGPVATYLLREPTRHANFRLLDGKVVMGQ